MKIKYLIIAACMVCACAAEPENALSSLVPEKVSQAPDYFCTWNIQGYVNSYADLRKEMMEENIFGEGEYRNWIDFFPEIRSDLFFVMDDSWDIPAGPSSGPKPFYGTDVLDTTRFPSFTGSNPERLGALCRAVEGKGWKGLGGWICAQMAENVKDLTEEEFFTLRLKEAAEAGFRYWKVDWGTKERDGEFRRMLTRLGHELAPELYIEHALNNDFVTFSDVYRTYDVENVISQPVTIRRVCDLLPYRAEEGSKSLINCEDEPYIAAGLGCAIGIMRHPFAGPLPDGTPDYAFPSTVRDIKNRLDEVTRAVRWHRIALPFAVDGDYQADSTVLTDRWILAGKETWVAERKAGDILEESAPARVSRRMPLPEVDSQDPNRPFVLASSYPDGALAVASIGRSIGREYLNVPVGVTVRAESLETLIGVFGRYEYLSVEFPETVEGCRILAQDLAGDIPVDITGRVSAAGKRLTLTGEVINEVGLMAARPGDLSDPGLVLKVEKIYQRADYLWGDQGDGTYVNPVLNADYSDPDVIRVDDRYYMVASDFHYLGMQMLESEDMVNWKLASQLYDRFDLPGWDGNNHYAGGSWAPSLRYHDGLFQVYFCTPEEGLFMTTASDPHGPWAPLHQVRNVFHWEDPCPLWDENGDAYLLHSIWGAGPIILHRMSRDGKELLDEGITIYEGPTAEGPKYLRKDGWHYISIPEGGVGGGWQTVLRSRSLYGPYEKKIVLEQGPTDINGPHQGALVDTPAGDWWFYHFQETSPIGRVVHLQPVKWEDGWPMIGEDADGNGVGNPVSLYKCPFGKSVDVHVPAASDSFDGDAPGLQWQFCHNPHDGFWSMDNGKLVIRAQKAESVKMAHNILTQKVMGWKGDVSVEMYADSMKDGQKAGLISMGARFCSIGISKENGKLFLYQECDGKTVTLGQYEKDRICLGLSYDARKNVFQLLAGPDIGHLKAVGDEFSQANRFWKGCRIGLYTFNTESDAGTVLYDDFRYDVASHR